ncbi:MAG: 2,3-bisphosphoglycerate-independent phosphoglycerate mutase [Thermoplasmata archaeon]
MEKRVILVVCDGLGDRPVEELGGRTPLQAAATPNLDWFAAQGACGQVDVIAPGIRPGSDTAHLALFGYNPYEIYTGRGPFEAAGVRLDVQEGDVAFRCNFATLDKKGRVVDRRAGRIRVGTDELAASLTDMTLEGVRLAFRAGTEHRGALVLRGTGLDPRVTDGDPHSVNVPVAEVKALAPAAEKTARVVNQFLRQARDVLSTHPVNKERLQNGQPPANALLTRGAGRMADIRPVTEKWGLRFAAVAGVALVKGICRVVGMDLLSVEGATGGLDSDLDAKISAGMGGLEDHDVVVVSIKAPDIAAHDGKPDEKARVIERIDQSLGPLREAFREEWVFGVTADHTTPSATGDHSADPVPLLVYGEGIRTDEVTRYDEMAVTKGSLARLRGVDVLPLLLDLADRTEKFGA